MREFVGVDLGQERVLDETTICKFRHLLEHHELGKELFRGSYTSSTTTAIPRAFPTPQRGLD